MKHAVTLPDPPVLTYLFVVSDSLGFPWILFHSLTQDWFSLHISLWQCEGSLCLFRLKHPVPPTTAASFLRQCGLQARHGSLKPQPQPCSSPQSISPSPGRVVLLHLHPPMPPEQSSPPFRWSCSVTHLTDLCVHMPTRIQRVLM